MNGLPFIDAHSTPIEAAPEIAWDAAARLLPRLGGRGGEAFARLLGCSEAERPEPGRRLPAAIVGFRIAQARRPSLIALCGEHRFSRYALTFRIDPRPGFGSLLTAETYAEFPSPVGRVYRAAVIGTRAHVVVVRRLLASVKRAAERRGYPAGQPAGSSPLRSS